MGSPVFIVAQLAYGNAWKQWMERIARVSCAVTCAVTWQFCLRCIRDRCRRKLNKEGCVCIHRLHAFRCGPWPLVHCFVVHYLISAGTSY